MFIDTATIEIQAGNGGAGAIAFRREKFVPKGGPSGGDGGNGGDVVFIASAQLSTLMDFRYKRKYEAVNGAGGGNSMKTGRAGSSVEVRVPVGTLIRDAATGATLADLTKDMQRSVLAKGGIGGHGNARFATSTNQAPRTSGKGTPGEARTVELELKLLADVGLVGFPNVGKSTLIARISSARPKIADYPFTTLIPNIGIVYVDEGRSFAVADIPGLIEGASLGKGIGHQFLRHVERSGVLCFMMDGLSDDPMNEYTTLINELRQYNPEMLLKRRIVCVSKSDAMTEESREQWIGKSVDGFPVLLISAVGSENIDVLIQTMERELKLWRNEQ